MATLVDVTISTDSDTTTLARTGKKHNSVQRLRNLLKRVEYTSVTSPTIVFREAEVKASGTITIASGSGTITGTINGVGLAITWATNDWNSASLLAAAINASSNALVSGFVTATSSTNVVTVTAVRGGLPGNAITLAASGTGATASGARLTAGAETTKTFTF